jgi:hypothetical protein
VGGVLGDGGSLVLPLFSLLGLLEHHLICAVLTPRGP